LIEIQIAGDKAAFLEYGCVHDKAAFKDKAAFMEYGVTDVEPETDAGRGCREFVTIGKRRRDVQNWVRDHRKEKARRARDHRKEKARRAELAAEETEEPEKARLAEMAEEEAEEAEKRGGGANQVSGMDAWVGPGNSNSCIHLYDKTLGGRVS
jgi:hypothetical protein